MPDKPSSGGYASLSVLGVFYSFFLSDHVTGIVCWL